MHYLQDVEGRKFDEEEANAFGFSVFTPCYQQGKKDISEKAIKKFEQEKSREKPLSVTNILWDRAINILKELCKE
jgi:glutathionylspermidine synthase